MKSPRILCAAAACLLLLLAATTAPAATLPVTDSLFVWYDASVGVTGTTDVTLWEDQSTSGYNLSVPSGTSTSPSLVTSDSALNGLASLDFDGTLDALRVGYGSTVGLEDASIFVVFVPENDTALNMLVAHRSGSTPLIQASFQAGDLRVQARSSSLYQTATDGGSLDVGKLGFYEVNGSDADDSVTAILNGEATSTSTVAADFASAINSSLLTVGAYSTGTGNPNGGQFDGRIAEIIIYSDLLTAAEKNAVGNYLALKYGLATSYTPEPGTLAMLVGAAGALVLVARRRRKTA